MSADRKRKLDVEPKEEQPIDIKRKLEAGIKGLVKAEPVVPTLNPFTGRQYSQRYYDILHKRLGAPRADIDY